MEGTVDAFFFQGWGFGLNNVVLSLVEYPGLDWDGRGEYLRAAFEKRAVDLYADDLIWMIVKAISARFGGSFDNPSPSSIEMKRHTKDTRSADEIKSSLLKKLTEE